MTGVTETDIVIVGGGLTGLALAFRLQQAGLDYILLEARPRLGGRVFSVTTPQPSRALDAYDQSEFHPKGVTMEINANFNQRAVVHGATTEWVPSPMKGVDRRMLDRIGEEVARATSIVRYAPNSSFSPHVHTGGEEFLVLQGVFQDEHGDFPAGSYVRNPPESRHTPKSAPGCVIMVKLWQFDLQDRTEVKLRTHELRYENDDDRVGIATALLHQDDREVVRMEKWAPNTQVELAADGGIEVFVLEGAFSERGEHFNTWSWLRLPQGTPLIASAGPDGAHVWLKTGHLRFVAPPATP